MRLAPYPMLLLLAAMLAKLAGGSRSGLNPESAVPGRCRKPLWSAKAGHLCSREGQAPRRHQVVLFERYRRAPSWTGAQAFEDDAVPSVPRTKKLTALNS